MAALKITLTLPEDLLAGVDRYVAAHPGATRSGICSEALRGWLQAQYDAELTAYYESLSDAERAEARAWAGLSAASAARTWR